MEPFSLNLQQVTFECGDLSEDATSTSFNNAVHYDYDLDVVESSTQTGDSFLKDLTPVCTPSELQCTSSAGLPGRPDCRTAVTNSVWSDLKPSTCPSQHIFAETVANVKSLHGSKTSVISAPDPKSSEIKILQQISSNTSALKNYSKLSMSCSTEKEKSATDNLTSPENYDSSAFENVAEALHLQWSVIGNKNITPASPEVVAQIVAEAQKQHLLGNSQEHSHNVSLADLVPSKDGTLPFQEQIADSTSSSKLHSFENETNYAQNAASSKSKDPACTKIITVPAENIVREKSSWFGKSNKSKKTTSQEDTTQNIDTRSTIKQQVPELKADERISSEPADNERPDDIQSVSSYSSEKELSMLNSENDTEIFLQSLPKYKPVDMSQFATKPKFIRDYSPPVRDTAFVAHSTPKSKNISQTPDAIRSDSETSSLVDSEYSIPVQTVDFPSFIIPQAGPLFSNKQYNIPTKRQVSDVSVSASDTQVANLLLEKTKLEGQLEMLTQEVQGTLQERAELHAQVASLKLKLMSSKSSESDPEKESLRSNVSALQEVRISCEKSLTEAQKELEDKTQEIKILQEDIQLSQDVNNKLQMRVKELLDEYRSKEITIQALKNKVAELYVDVQTAIQAKMESDTEARNVKNEHSSLLNAKQWYQQQLQTAQEARSQIQKELTLIQAQFSSQGNIVERLKTDNIKLRLQLTETQQRALKEKELLARHLETIQADMMEREAAFQEIQRERSLIEDTFNYKIQSVNDEQSRISVLLQGMNTLESQLDKAHNDLKKKQSQIFTLENEHMETMKQLTISQENILDKDRIIEELEQKLIEVETKLKAFQNDIEQKEKDILKLREDKATTEISLNAVMEEKLSVDRALDVIKGDLAKVEKSFKQMKLDLNARDIELENVKQERNERRNLQELAEKQLTSLIKNQDISSGEADRKNSFITELQVRIQILEEEGKSLKQNLERMQINCSDLENNRETLNGEIVALTNKLAAVEQELKVAKHEQEITKEAADTLKSAPVTEVYIKDESLNEQNSELQKENQKLKESINKIEKDNKKDLTKQKAKTAKANADMKLIQEELTKRQSTFDSEIHQLTVKLHEIISEKDRLETELEISVKKNHLASIETKEQIQSEIQSLADDLEKARLEKKHLETQMLQLQEIKNNEIIQYKQQLSMLESHLEETLEIHSQCSMSEETRQKLELELEKERGRVIGLMQSNSGLKQHITQLEEALANRESSVVEIQTKMQEELKERERLGQECNRRIQQLEGNLQKEKNNQRELRKQIGSKITENKKLQRHSDSIKLEHEQVKQELSNKLQNIEQLRSEISRLSEVDNNHQATIFSVQNENKSLVREVEKLKREVDENSSRNPLVAEQIQNLQWQLSQKCQEVDVLNDKLNTLEERQALEVDGLKNIIQKNQTELESLRNQLSAAKQEKMSQQSRVSELRSTLKASVQHHKLTKKMRSIRKERKSNETTDVGTQVEPDDYDVPPLPFDLDVVEKLIQDTTVSALQSKPLNNLQSCLSALRNEITGLQTEMDSHKLTVETSSQSWKTVENHVEELQEAVKVVTTAISSISSPSNISIANNMKKDQNIIDL